MPKFENYDRREKKIQQTLNQYGWHSLEEAEQFCLAHHVDPRAMVRETQTIAFDNAQWAYALGAAIALKKGQKQRVSLRMILVKVYRRFVFPALLLSSDK